MRALRDAFYIILCLLLMRAPTAMLPSQHSYFSRVPRPRLRRRHAATYNGPLPLSLDTSRFKTASYQVPSPRASAFESPIRLRRATEVRGMSCDQDDDDIATDLPSYRLAARRPMTSATPMPSAHMPAVLSPHNTKFYMITVDD